MVTTSGYLSIVLTTQALAKMLRISFKQLKVNIFILVHPFIKNTDPSLWFLVYKFNSLPLDSVPYEISSPDK